MLGLAVCRQRPRCQIRHVFRAPDPLPFTLLEGGSHPRYPPLVGRLRVYAGHSTGLSEHTHRIIDAGVQAHPIT